MNSGKKLQNWWKIYKTEIDMKKFKVLFTALLTICLSQCLYAQTFSSETNRKEAERILNTVINSMPFDSLYSAKKVYFKANELLSTDSPLVLKRKGCRVSIVEKEILDKKGGKYVVLGDFTIDWNNPVSVRVQLSIMPEDSLLTMSLIKEDKNWIVRSHKIFKD